MTSQLSEKFAAYLTKVRHPYISKVAKDLEITELEVLGLVSLLNSQNHSLVIDSKGRIIPSTPAPHTTPTPYQIPHFLDHVRLLLLSDTHLNSKYDRLDILNYLYDKADSTHTNYILHAGDITEGLSGRPEQLYELKNLSYTDQRDYVVDKYPTTSLPTYFISGNHDMWWIKQCGSDICRDIASRRPDLHYLGSDCETLAIGSLRIRLYHGKGGSSYARSYKLQKYLDSIPPKERPHLLVTGHIHQAFYMKQGDTHCFQTGCLQDLTPYARSLGFSSEKSCWWVDVSFDDNGKPHQIKQELEEFGDRLIRKR